jgi:transcriptional regulator with XRE-family HTH domain
MKRKDKDSDFFKALVELLSDLRHASGLTQAQLADKLGSHQGLVSNLEKRKRGLTVFQLRDLAAVYGYGIYDFMRLLEENEEEMLARVAAREWPKAKPLPRSRKTKKSGVRMKRRISLPP